MYNGATITYDEIGNPLTYRNNSYYTFTWDGRRLTSATKTTMGSTSYSFTYNDEGIRTSKTAGSTTHYYTLDGSRIVSEEWGNYFAVYLYDESGAPIGMQIRQSSMADGVFHTYYFEKNLQGDIIGVYNSSGALVYSYVYDAWGNFTATKHISSDTYAVYNPFRYRGYYYDSDLGFYYLNSRYYDSVTGRFINADGYINANGDMIGYNMFAYCSNNPVMYTDRSGESLFGAICIIAAWVSLIIIPIAEPLVSMLGCLEDIDASDELYNSDRLSSNDDCFTEKSIWYEVDGGSVKNANIGYIEAAVGADRGIYEWKYFELEVGWAKLSGEASTTISQGFGLSGLAETVYGTATVKIPIFGHTLSIGATGNLGSIGATFKFGKTTKIGFSNGIGGGIVISWD